MRKINYTLIYGCLLLSIVLGGCTPTRLAPEDENNLVSAKLNVQLGVGYLQQGRVGEAKQKLLLSLRQAPHWAPVFDALAYYYSSIGDLNLAEHYYKSALRLDAYSGALLNNYGVFLCRHYRYKESERYFLLAVADKNYANAAKAYENAALCALKNNNVMRAKYYFAKALQLDPQSKVIYDSRNRNSSNP